MKTNFIKSFEERVAFYVFLSAMVTVAAELLTGLLIRQISSELRRLGYRSAMMGPDGLNPAFRVGILLVVGLLVFMLSFYYLIRRYMKYVRIISRGWKISRMETSTRRSRWRPWTSSDRSPDI